MKGFCFMFSNGGSWINDLEPTVNETKEFVGNLRTGMMLLDKLSASTPAQTTSDGAETHSSAKAQTDFTSGGEVTQTSATPLESPAALNRTIVQATIVVLDANKKRDLESKGWFGREGLHKDIVKGTVSELKTKTSYVINALAFLPYNNDDQQGLRFPKENFVKVDYWNLNYFVFYATSSDNQTAAQAWGKLENNRDALLYRVFGKKGQNLRQLLPTALSENNVDEKKFGAIVAVKCGYKFVWYQLGYTYFYAAQSSTGYKWQTKGGEYDAKCGQLFFFP